MAGNFASRTVPLSRNGERIVFDVAGGFVRMAHYQPNLVWDKEKKRKVIDGEVRTTIKKRTLRDALITVLGEANSNQDPHTVEAYIRATPWGRDLP